MPAAKISLPHVCLAAVLLSAAASAAPPLAQWQAVASGGGGTIEIDKGRIGRLKGGKTAAWTRLMLDRPALDFENSLRYTTVQALTYYDCDKGSFATQQRIYLLDGREMKVEKVAGTMIPVRPDTVDASVLDEVCKPRTIGEMQQTAERAAAAAAAVSEARPRIMRAEMVSDTKSQPLQTLKVANAQASPPSATAAEKMRLFEVPAIDKSKAEDPYKGTTPATAAKVAQKASKPAMPAAPPKLATLPGQDLSRQEREVLLATSGPRKTKKAPEKAHDLDVAPRTPEYAHVHWGYAGLGAPENWAKLRPEYALCGSGSRQSPIDIKGGIRVDLEPIKFDYKPTEFRITDNGHTVQVDVADGNTITLMGRSYTLMHLHFHRPAEERINGRQFDMVAHLVHKDLDNHLAVVAVPIDRGSEHQLIQTLWNYMPLEVGMSSQPPGVAIDPTRLLPERREYYTYMGSLTTPPCTEGVLWLVLKNPIQVSSEQIGIFARLYPHNARPIQPTHDRLIKESR